MFSHFREFSSVNFKIYSLQDAKFILQNSSEIIIDLISQVIITSNGINGNKLLLLVGLLPPALTWTQWTEQTVDISKLFINNCSFQLSCLSMLINSFSCCTGCSAVLKCGLIHKAVSKALFAGFFFHTCFFVIYGLLRGPT